MSRRRDSIVQASEAFQDYLQERLLLLRNIWDRVGITEDQRKQRMLTAVGHLTNLVKEMISEEQEMEQQLQASIESCLAQVETLCGELHVARPLPENDGSLIKTEAGLRAIVEELSATKQRRLKRFQELCAEHRQVCGELQVPLHRLVLDGELDLPSDEQLNDLEQHLQNNKAELDMRRHKVNAAKDRLRKMFRLLNRTAVTVIEKQLMIGPAENFAPTSENMGLLESELKTLEEEYQEQLGKLQFKIADMRVELVDLWDKCCVVDQHKTFPDFLSDDYSEELFDAHRNEIDRLKQLYGQNKSVFDRVNEWRSLFAKMIEFEARAQDPNRYKNRGGALLKEEQERKEVLRRLPKVTERLKQEAASWNVNAFGLPICDFIEHEIQRFEREKENKKLSKQKQKLEQFEVELKFGVSSVTTPKKNIQTTTPRKWLNSTRNDQAVPGSSSKPMLHSVLRSPLVLNALHCSPSATIAGIGRPPVCPRPPVAGSVRSQFGSTHTLPAKRKAAGTPLHSTLQSPHRRLPVLSTADMFSNASHSTLPSIDSYHQFEHVLHNSGDYKQSSFISDSMQSKRKK